MFSQESGLNISHNFSHTSREIQRAPSPISSRENELILMNEISQIDAACARHNRTSRTMLDARDQTNLIGNIRGQGLSRRPTIASTPAESLSCLHSLQQDYGVGQAQLMGEIEIITTPLTSNNNYSFAGLGQDPFPLNSPRPSTVNQDQRHQQIHRYLQNQANSHFSNPDDPRLNFISERRYLSGLEESDQDRLYNAVLLLASQPTETQADFIEKFTESARGFEGQCGLDEPARVRGALNELAGGLIKEIKLQGSSEAGTELNTRLGQLMRRTQIQRFDTWFSSLNLTTENYRSHQRLLGNYLQQGLAQHGNSSLRLTPDILIRSLAEKLFKSINDDSDVKVIRDLLAQEFSDRILAHPRQSTGAIGNIIVTEGIDLFLVPDSLLLEVLTHAGMIEAPQNGGQPLEASAHAYRHLVDQLRKHENNDTDPLLALLIAHTPDEQALESAVTNRMKSVRLGSTPEHQQGARFPGRAHYRRRIQLVEPPFGEMRRTPQATPPTDTRPPLNLNNRVEEVQPSTQQVVRTPRAVRSMPNMRDSTSGVQNRASNIQNRALGQIRHAFSRLTSQLTNRRVPTDVEAELQSWAIDVRHQDFEALARLSRTNLLENIRDCFLGQRTSLTLNHWDFPLPASINQLKALTHLTLNGCNLSQIPLSLEGLNNLESLDLSSNNLTELPQSIFHLPESCQINLRGNFDLPNSVKNQLQSQRGNHVLL